MIDYLSGYIKKSVNNTATNCETLINNCGVILESVNEPEITRDHERNYPSSLSFNFLISLSDSTRLTSNDLILDSKRAIAL